MLSRTARPSVRPESRARSTRTSNHDSIDRPRNCVDTTYIRTPGSTPISANAIENRIIIRAPNRPWRNRFTSRRTSSSTRMNSSPAITPLTASSTG
jgi:hypothetical protein